MHPWPRCNNVTSPHHQVQHLCHLRPTQLCNMGSFSQIHNYAKKIKVLRYVNWWSSLTKTILLSYINRKPSYVLLLEKASLSFFCYTSENQLDFQIEQIMPTADSRFVSSWQSWQLRRRVNEWSERERPFPCTFLWKCNTICHNLSGDCRS